MLSERSERGLTVHSYQRDALILEPHQDAAKTVVAYGVAMVFTPVKNRRRGYAQHMMRLLHWVISNADFRSSHLFPQAWGAPPEIPEGLGNGVFSVLYSGIGPTFYTKCGENDAQDRGWQVDKPLSTFIPVPPKDPIVKDSNGWRILDPAQAEDAWAEDAAQMKKDIEAHSKTGTATIVSFLPTNGISAFQTIRQLEPTTGELPTDKWGVRLDDQTESLTYATWTPNPQGGRAPKRLVVTRLRVSSSQQFEELIHQVLKAALELEFRYVEIWNLSTEFHDVATALGGRTSEREDRLSSIKYYGKDSAQVEWAFNERSVTQTIELTPVLTYG
jgi:hypothetical protein